MIDSDCVMTVEQPLSFERLSVRWEKRDHLCKKKRCQQSCLCGTFALGSQQSRTSYLVYGRKNGVAFLGISNQPAQKTCT